MKKYHVYSKMAADVRYNDYIGGGDTLHRIAKSVLIKGGAGVANKNIITPLGVHTEIDSEDRDMLLKNGIFNLHLESGFVTIESAKEDADLVATNLTEGPDPSAPLTPNDYEGADRESVAVPQVLSRDIPKVAGEKPGRGKRK